MAKNKKKNNIILTPEDYYTALLDLANYYEDGGQTKEDAKPKINAGAVAASAAGALSGMITSGLNQAQSINNNKDAVINAANQTANNIDNSATSMESVLDQSANMQTTAATNWRQMLGKNKGQEAAGVVDSMASGASAGASAGPIGAGIGAGIGLLGGLFTMGAMRRKAKRAARAANQAIAAANEQAEANMSALADKVENAANMESLANYAADGGPIFMRYSGVSSPFGNRFKDGGIHIKPENRGKFTRLKERTGKSATWFKEHGTPAQKKMATFALNAAKWHADGGSVNGGNFSNGVTYINNGGTHEENPYNGVQVSTDEQGIPNLVEEGEVLFNDYVFSNRLKVPEDAKKAFGISGKKKTFADAAKNIAKESEERPNDPISLNGLNTMLSMLREVQEDERFKKDMRDPKKRAALREQMAQQMQQLQQSQQGDTNSYSLGGDLEYVDTFDKNYTKWGWPVVNDYEDKGDSWDNILKKSVGVNPSRVKIPYDPENALSPTIDRVEIKGAPDNNPTTNTIKPGNNTTKPATKDWQTWLRYAPVLGGAIGVAQGLFSKPDYSNADAILEASREAGKYIPVEASYIGNYMRYNPFDRNYWSNRAEAQANATRRAVVEQSGANKAAAINALLTANYANQLGLSDLAVKGEEYNRNQEERVSTFNRTTDIYNADAATKAAIANQEALARTRAAKLSGLAQAAAIRDNVDARRSQSMSANLTNLFNSLGAIGKEAFARNMVLSNPALYYSIDNKGVITYKNGFDGLSEAEKARVVSAAEKDAKSRKNG